MNYSEKHSKEKHSILEKVQKDNTKETNIEGKIKNRNSWLLFIVVISIIIISSYSLITGKVNIDGMTLLSFLLAFFSIFLSATFYFKATEQSNQFYDRSYSHTKDIAESLSSMRGEFGKSLSLLEENNASLHRRIDLIPWSEIKDKKDLLTNKQKERDLIIEELLNKAGLKSEEKEKYEKHLMENEEMINELKNEISTLRNYKNNQSLGDVQINNLKEFVTTIIFFFVDNEELIERIKNGTPLEKEFNEFVRLLSGHEQQALYDYGIITKKSELTTKGKRIITNLL